MNEYLEFIEWAETQSSEVIHTHERVIAARKKVVGEVVLSAYGVAFDELIVALEKFRAEAQKIVDIVE